ncbi:MAG TPA: RecX family transcriptional regulator [Terriglobia bacterium]|nr:RecX family transcriptional regulator [Terriglobia bacterium]
MDEIYHHALKLLRRKDYTTRQLLNKLSARFGDVPERLAEQLVAKGYLDDRRYADNFAERHSDHHRNWVRQALQEAGVDDETVDIVISNRSWPSLPDVLKAKIVVRRLQPPLERRDVARLFRLLSRLGYPEEDIREVLEQLHEQ